jgi:hypothetical protein
VGYVILRKDSILKRFAKASPPGMAERYVLKTPTSVITMEDGTRKVMVVPSNSVVDVATPLTGIQGLIEVEVNGETVLMFAEDILQRGKRVSRASA